jgi:CDP-6-deoxy-D-xylo-4-hexulose-3-dehydrase
MGDNVRRFEIAFSEKIGKRFSLMVSSGSTANLVGIAALFYKKNRPLRRGDEVIVPSISWATTYYPLQQYGLKLKFLDVELDTLNMDTTLLEKALTPNTRMVVAVSVLGNPCALDKIRDFCDRNGLYLFEDNCESMGAELNGRQCGSFGDIGTFSTFYSHHISTMEGGILVTDDEEIYHVAKSIRAHGWTRDLPPGSQIFDERADDFFEAYRFILPGYNARPLEFSGAVGLEQLKKVDNMIEIRRNNAKLFCQLFNGDDRFIIQRENGKSSWFSFTVILNPDFPIDRAKVMKGLKEAKISFRVITGGNFLRHDVIKYFDYECVGDIKNANFAHDRGFFVGNFPRDISTEIQYFHKVITGLVN